MNASLRVALTYLDFAPRQKLMMGIGLVMQVLAGSSMSLGGRTPLFTLSGLFLVCLPALAGGLAMRAGSTPTALHLYPRTRLPMLGGATVAVTCMALLMALPLLLRQLAGFDASIGDNDPANPVSSQFQVMWGSAALIWVMGFTLSQSRFLPTIGIMALVVISNQALRFDPETSITADQLASGVFMAGVAAWGLFALWYLRIRAVQRPSWISEWATGTGPSVLAELGALRAIWRWAPANAVKGRSSALRQYLLGADSILPYVLAGLLVVAVLALEHRFSPAAKYGRSLLWGGLFLLAALCLGCGSLIVRRSRLLWLRAALDRGALFATAERESWRAAITIAALPGAAIVAMTLASWPDLILNALLFIVLQLAIVGCAVYVGLGVTRGWSGEAIGFAIVLFAPASAISSVLAPPHNAPVWGFVVAIALVGAIAAGLRRSARLAWLEMDWRLTQSLS
jgi:hypothetical protein